MDKVLLGYIQTTSALLNIYIKTSSYEDLLAFEKDQGFLHELFFEQLFYRPGLTKSASLTKCKHNLTREKTQDLLLVYVTNL